MEPTTVAAAISSANIQATNDALISAGTGVMDTFVQYLPSVVILTVIGFGIWFVSKRLGKARKGK